MSYLIDGHNLIPKIPGVNLDDLDDEQHLIELLQEYFRCIRKKAVLFFDRGKPGNRSIQNTEFLQVHFVRLPSTADQAIIAFLKNQGGAARKFTVISSDHEVCDAVHHFGARVLSSDLFASMLSDGEDRHKKIKNSHAKEIDYWLKKFQEKS